MESTATTVISEDINELIRFLKHSGASIMKGDKKFTVTPAILRKINDVLEMMRKDIFVSSLTNRDLIRKFAKNDLMFLYDFVKKTPNLKISNTLSSHEISDIFVDVQDFSNLSYLELYKFSAKQMKNVEFLRERLEAVICFRSLENVGDLLLSRNGLEDKIWILKHAIFSRNSISTLDQSFIYTPYLQYLDLSYNHLTDLCQLTTLLNLTYLNASYNNLKEIPEFPPKLKLRTLLLSNNYITDIKGISKLENLRECDLSENLLAEHVDLFPLSELQSLTSLNISRNPICYHPMYRNLTCGYLHENVANEYFLLDKSPLTSSEREFIRRCSRSNSISFTRGSSLRGSSVSLNSEREKETVIKKKKKKKVREPIIAGNYDDDEDINASVPYTTSTPVKDKECDFEKYLEVKKEIETLRAIHGPKNWLHGRSGVKVQQMLNINDPISSPLSTSAGVSDLVMLHSETPADEAKKLMESFMNEEESYLENVLSGNENNDDSNDRTFTTNNQGEKEPSITWSSSDSQSEDSDDESDTGESLWLATKINSNSSEEKIFLTLTDTQLKERVVGNEKSKLKDGSVAKNKLIKRWNISCIERYVKVSSEPLTLALHFNVLRKSDQYRKYVMEFADAQKLMSRIEEERNRKPLEELLDHEVFHCIKCNTYFGQERQRRSAKEEVEYKCPACGSQAVIKEENPALLLPSKSNAECSSSPDKKTSENKNVKVTQSPSMSSIGSAASLDQKSEITNGESGASCQESDIEIISNPSQSSIEVLEVHSGDNTRTVFQRLPFTDASAVLNLSLTNNHNLTESSSSGSMTDSVCTSYETSNHITRGQRHISQSTVDEVLMEETSAESSPQQRQSEEKNIATDTKKSTFDISDKDKRPPGNAEPRKIRLRGGYLPEDNDIKKLRSGSFTSVLEDVIQRITMSSSPRKSIPDVNGFSNYNYSYTDFTQIDHRIKLYIWDQIVPTNEEISAFVRVNAICKSGTSYSPFAGFLVLTNKKMYIIKITGEEKGIGKIRAVYYFSENPAMWLQKNDSANTDKIKLIQPIYWKQGFCIDVDDRSSYNTNAKYLMLLYDEKRTNNFLSFVRDLGTVHVQKSDDFSEEKDLKNLLELDENIRNFTLTDSIILYKEDVEFKNFCFVGLIITNSDFMILKGETDWLLPNSPTKPSVLLKESMCNLTNIEKTSSSIKLDFVDGDEIDTVKTVWEVDVVTSESSNLIIDAIREPWRQLLSSRIAN